MDDNLNARFLTYRSGGFNPSESIAYARTCKVFAYLEKLGLVHLEVITAIKTVPIGGNITYTEFRELIAVNESSLRCKCPNKPTLKYNILFDFFDVPGNTARYLYAMRHVKLAAIYRVCE